MDPSEIGRDRAHQIDFPEHCNLSESVAHLDESQDAPWSPRVLVSNIYMMPAVSAHQAAVVGGDPWHPTRCINLPFGLADSCVLR